MNKIKSKFKTTLIFIILTALSLHIQPAFSGAPKKTTKKVTKPTPEKVTKPTPEEKIKPEIPAAPAKEPTPVSPPKPKFNILEFIKSFIATKKQKEEPTITKIEPKPTEKTPLLKFPESGEEEKPKAKDLPTKTTEFIDSTKSIKEKLNKLKTEEKGKILWEKPSKELLDGYEKFKKEYTSLAEAHTEKIKTTPLEQKITTAEDIRRQELRDNYEGIINSLKQTYEELYKQNKTLANLNDLEKINNDLEKFITSVIKEEEALKRTIINYHLSILEKESTKIKRYSILEESLEKKLTESPEFKAEKEKLEKEGIIKDKEVIKIEALETLKLRKETSEAIEKYLKSEEGELLTKDTKENFQKELSNIKISDELKNTLTELEKLDQEKERIQKLITEQNKVEEKLTNQITSYQNKLKEINKTKKRIEKRRKRLLKKEKLPE